MTSIVKLALFVAAIGILINFRAIAETRVGGILYGENHWGAESGPYIVESDIVVDRFAHLTILPGTTVVIDTGRGKDTTIKQIDALDSTGIAIKVEGTLLCAGKKNKRISFAPGDSTGGKLGWYGIVIYKANGRSSELAYTDVSGAYNGVTIYECRPLLKNSVFERNNIGINCLKNGSALIYNCICTDNVTAGIRVQKASPHVANSIIAFNRNNGLWCDNSSSVSFDYNCVFGNGDGDFFNCDPQLGINVCLNKNKDSADYAGNLHYDPLFAGSRADSIAFVRDTKPSAIHAKTDKINTAKTTNDTTFMDSSFINYRAKKMPRYFLSRYSPCINAGNPAASFKDADGSQNDIGVFGGPEFSAKWK
jgi:hypothetical protein